ncbi:MAG: hypothetical protein WBQ72_08025 [Terriglobales bacterium]|jgi:hypothetical protein
MMGRANRTPARRILAMAAGCIVLVMASYSPATYGADSGLPSDPRSNTRRVTFVQMTAPHLFDAGVDRHAEGVEEEALDNRAAFHWAVLETNRMVLAEHRTIDFVVITGGFGLRNVSLSSAAKKCECPKRDKGREGPIGSVSMAEAVGEVARELDALEVRRIYLVPGNDDLCDESPTDRHRWATFVWLLQAELKARQKTREAALKLSYPEKKDVQVAEPPEVVDLSFTLERLRADKDPSVSGLGDSTNATIPDPPVVDGFSLLGLNSTYFNSHDNPKIQTASKNEIPKEIAFLQNRIQPGGSYLIFTHTADVLDPDAPPANPAPGKKADKKTDKKPDAKADKTADQKPDRQAIPAPDSDSTSPWVLPADTRKVWHDQILPNTQIVGVFGGHFYSGNRGLYPHSFNSPDKLTSAKTWLAPPLSARNQWTMPPEKTARGILLVTVTGNGTVLSTPMWYTVPDQAAAIDGQEKLIQARADEVEGNWDAAATLYTQALTAKDSRVRASAAQGYERCRAVTRTWWWQLGKYFPPLRWIAIYPRRMAWLIPILLSLLAAFTLLRWLRFLYLGELIKFLIIPRFRGRALLHATVEMTKDAPTGQFQAQMLAAQEEIRTRLLGEQENWMAGHVALLTPASESFDTLVASIPKVGEVDIPGLVKFLVQLARAFQWTVDSGLAVLSPDTPSAAGASGADPTALPPGGELSAYAVLQWAWLTKNSWRRKTKIVDNSAVRELARELAELIFGEAFV